MKTSENSRQNASALSKLLFCWMLPLFKVGFKRDIEKDDLGKPLETDQSQMLGDKLERLWLEEVKLCKKSDRKPSLLKTLVKTFISQYILDGFLVFVQYVGCKTFQPLLLAMLLSELGQEGAWLNKDRAGLLATALISLSLFGVFLQHHTTLRQQQLGMRLRISCCSLVYRKILKLNTCTLNRITAGQIVNMMSNDVNRFDSVLKFLHVLWVAPLQMILCFYLYNKRVSSLTFIGILFVMLPTVPIQSLISKFLGVFRLKIARRTDERVKKMNEIVCGIQTIKMYAWEEPFEEAVTHARNNEIKYLTFASYLRGINASFLMFTERASLYVTLLSHVYLGLDVTAPTVYSLSQFYNMLQTMLTFVYPHAITSSVECLVSVQRIEEFLLLEEKEPSMIFESFTIHKNIQTSLSIKRNSDYIYKIGSGVPKTLSEEGIFNKSFEECGKDSMNEINDNNLLYVPEDLPVVEMNNVTASWTNTMKEDEATLKNISIKFEKGKLYAIIGTIGSGKTTLLQLILKEVTSTKGSVNVNGDLSYACQEPWLFVATVRENILFGLPYEQKRYKQIVRVCALEKDFSQLPQGDHTLVGERGVSLSGGQKARINLARTIYRRADLYLLDDPLSGVDMQVGNYIYKECFMNYLKNKTRVIITHNLHYLKSADVIIILNNGVIENKGSYEDLVNSGQNLEECINTIDNQATADDLDTTLLTPTNSIRQLSRKISITSIKSEFDDEEVISNKQEEEEKVSGIMHWSVYWKYWSSGGRPCLFVTMVLIMMVSHMVASSTDYWVTYWTNQNSVNENAAKLNFTETEHLVSNKTSRNLSGFLREFIGPLNNWEYIYIYSGLVGLCVTLSITSCILFYFSCMNSSSGLHKLMFQSILRAPMKFFDTNPSGRILNRFSKDLGNIDELLPKDMLEALQIVLFMMSALLMVVITNVWLLGAIFVLILIFFMLLIIYLRTAQDIKRLEGITRSPVFSHTCATIKGISTIRSSNSQKQLSDEFDAHQDIHTASWYQFLASRVTLGFWLDITGIMFVACVTFSFIYFKNDGSLSGDIGLAISQSLMLTSTLRFGVQQLTDVVSHFTSCERILQYTDIEKENSTGDRDVPPKKWPRIGNIEFKNISLTYGENQKPVLENFSIRIKGGWKVGIVGRTGAGKSSLIAALFRLAKIEGSITIDDLEIEDISLKELRSKISIIPQEPILFSASIRYNLDPYNQYDDASLWNALESVYLKDSIRSLDYQISEGGTNFSLGQRQLLCLARAILKNNKILVLDEATASMDQQTDNFIQQIIREKFSECTVLTIAHRLNTIMDADRVLVMGGGKCLEFNYPYLLLQNRESNLNSMVEETGSYMSASLYSLAKEHYKKIMLKERSQNVHSKDDESISYGSMSDE